jgi:hypothetical protein
MTSVTNDCPSTDKTRLCSISIIAIVIAFVGIVIPPCFAWIGLYFAEGGRAVTRQQVMVVLLCSILFVMLELLALGCAILGRRSRIGKVAIVISAMLLLASFAVLGLVLAICFDRNDFW